MKACLAQPDNSLAWQEVAAPEPGPGEVAIDVRAAGVNRGDLAQRQGLYPPPPGASEILGLECAGYVAALGEGVSGWKRGDPVCALLSGGGYAERVVCPAGQLLPVPAGFTFTQAAALPEVYATAWLNLFWVGGLAAGERVLVHAGASGVGTAATQIAAAFGHPVYVTAGSEAKLAHCRAQGASEGCNRHQADFVERVKAWSGGDGVALILDPVGGDYLERNLQALATEGRLVVIGVLGGRQGSLDMARLLVKRLSVVGSTLRSRDSAFKAELVAELSAQLWPHFGVSLFPIIDSVFDVTEAEKALAHLASNQTVGKVILRVPS